MENAKGSWFMKVLASINQLSEELGLDDLGSQKLREFVLAKCKEEYMAGNRSGIRWARTNPQKVAA
jgi:hypothetical protein